MRHLIIRLARVAIVFLVLSSNCANESEPGGVSIQLRDAEVEGGDPAFVSFEPGDASDGRVANPGLYLRRDGGDLNLLLPRTDELADAPTINAPDAPVPAVTLNAGVEYRFDIPDLEPGGGYELCWRYLTGPAAQQACADLTIT